MNSIGGGLVYSKLNTYKKRHQCILCKIYLLCEFHRRGVGTNVYSKLNTYKKRHQCIYVRYTYSVNSIGGGFAGGGGGGGGGINATENIEKIPSIHNMEYVYFAVSTVTLSFTYMYTIYTIVRI